jgi:hypothetical protein
MELGDPDIENPDRNAVTVQIARHLPTSVEARDSAYSVYDANLGLMATWNPTQYDTF